MFKSFRTTLLCALLLASSFAKTSAGLPSAAPAAVPDAGCRQDATDPDDLGWRIGADSDQMAGRCLNAKRLRPVHVTSEDAESITFANFVHDGHFWRARWRKDDLPVASAWTLFFPVHLPFVKVAHAQLRFEFPKGLELTDQRTGAKGPVIRDAIVSWETAFPEGVHFALIPTMRRNFPLVGRVLSTESTIHENTPLLGRMRETQLAPLSLTATQAAKLFERNLRAESETGFATFYRLFSMNCATQLFDQLDEVLRETPAQGPGVPRFHVGWSLDPVAGPVFAGLKLRHLVPADAKPIDLNQKLGLGVAE